MWDFICEQNWNIALIIIGIFAVSGIISCLISPLIEKLRPTLDKIQEHDRQAAFRLADFLDKPVEIPAFRRRTDSPDDLYDMKI